MVARQLDEVSTPDRVAVVVPLRRHGGAMAGTVLASGHHGHGGFGLGRRQRGGKRSVGLVRIREGRATSAQPRRVLGSVEVGRDKT